LAKEGVRPKMDRFSRATDCGLGLHFRLHCVTQLIRGLGHGYT